jgi:glycosyltransferase involved in cell wall biosynthesis
MTTRSIRLLVSGRLDQRTGGYIYDRRMAEGLRFRGWTVEVIELGESFPCPTPAALRGAAEALARIPSGTTTVIDSLVLGAMPALVEQASSRLQIVALVHLPLVCSTDLSPGGRAAVAEAEGRALHAAALVIVTGTATRTLLAPYGVPSHRIAVVEPGTDPAPIARGSRRKGGADVPLDLLCAATLNAGKGHERLLEALAAITDHPWRLTCAGSLERDPRTSDRVRATIARLGLDSRVSLVGDLDRDALAVCFDRADVFVLATRQETYGMAVAEALARGLPIVATRTGAIPELVGGDAGLVVPVDDTPSLTRALGRMVSDQTLRERLTAGALRVRDTLSRWEQQSARLAVALEAHTHG